jgi:hypothetical protein
LRIRLIYILFAVFFFACQKDKFESIDYSNDKNYISKKIGSYSEYSVQEIVYDDFKNTIDTFNYQLKELNESLFKDNLGRNSIRIDRYSRSNDTFNWSYVNTCYISIDVNSIERIENNTRKSIISFPISNDAIWNSNEFNMEYVNNVFYTSFHKPYSINSIKYDSSITVEGVVVSNSIKERAYKEVYVKQIGLVYKNIVFIDKIGTLQRGRRINYKLLKHVP